jgi:hypothetical protein
MKDDLSRALWNVTMTQFALESLRAKSIERVLEILEMQMDVGVLRLNTLAEEADADGRERVVSTLREVRAYRRVHPRRVESDLGTLAKGAIVRAVGASKERVRRILDEVE